MRPDWDEYWFDVVDKVASRSTCDRLHVGALIVIENRLIASGYNGAPSGKPHCTDIGCDLMPCEEHGEHCVRVTHAEINALEQIEWLMSQVFDSTRVFLHNAIMYVTHKPCHNCRTEIWKAGIRDIRWRDDY